MRKPSKNLWLWACALALPLVIILLAQIPLCLIGPLSDFFRDLDPMHAIYILTIVYVLPSYAVLLLNLHTRKQRLIHGSIFTALLIPYIPLLWVFGFYTSRLLFSSC